MKRQPATICSDCSILPLNGQPEAGCLSCSAPMHVYHSDLRCGDKVYVKEEGEVSDQ